MQNNPCKVPVQCFAQTAAHSLNNAHYLHDLSDSNTGKLQLLYHLSASTSESLAFETLEWLSDVFYFV